MCSFCVLIRIPELNRCIEVECSVVMAPANDLTAVDVPSKINEEVTFANMACKYFVKIFWTDLFLNKSYTLFGPWAKSFFIGGKINNCYPSWVNFNVAKKDWKCTASDESKANEQNFVIKGNHANM